MRGSYSIVASEMNRWLDWPDGRVVTRQNVQNWHVRRTLNKAGQLPPSAVSKRRKSARTSPTYLFESGGWLAWATAGVPGPRREGWVIPVLREQARPVMPAAGRPPEFVKPGDRVTWSAELTGIKMRAYTGEVLWTDDAVYARCEGHMWRVLWANVTHYYPAPVEMGICQHCRQRLDSAAPGTCPDPRAHRGVAA